jgi:DNA-binding PadR family transcriptional regulator
MSISVAEAALLGLLSEGAKHPYQIEKDVQFRDMRYWTELSMSAIYKLLSKLEFMNYVESQTELSAENRARKVYQLTPDGEEAFKEKLRELLSEAEHVRWQVDVAFYNLDMLEREEQISLLKAYRQKVEQHIAGYRDLEAFMTGEGCRIYPLSIALRPIFMMEGELRWVDDFIRRIEAQD